MGRAWLLLVCIGLIMLLAGCYNGPNTIVITGVHRIFMNDSREYTFMVKRNTADGKTVYRMWQKNFYQVPDIYTDVPPGDDMWVKFARYKQGDEQIANKPRYKVFAIHVHSMKDIEGGSWDHGKTGRGRTNVIE